MFHFHLTMLYQKQLLNKNIGLKSSKFERNVGDSLTPNKFTPDNTNLFRIQLPSKIRIFGTQM